MSPHLHIYREGYGDKWAAPLPSRDFLRPDDSWQMLTEFMRYCNIVETPYYTRGALRMTGEIQRLVEEYLVWLKDKTVLRQGRTGWKVHLFDFVIPKSVARPERILQALSRPRRDTAITTAFAWFDTRDVRPPN